MRILENGEYKYTWQQEQQMLEDAYARQLLIKHNIKEVTTQRQAINGTREFEFPVSALAPKTRYGRVNPNQFPKLRLACFKSGYVRKQNGCYSPYQLNPTYKRKKKWVFLEGNKTVTKTYKTISRARIYSGLARLNYMLEYYLKNYKQNTIKAR